MRFLLKFCLAIVMMATVPTISNAQFKDAGNEFSYAVKLFDQKFYDLAAQQFIKYYNNYPNSNNSDEAKFYAGRALFNLQDYSNARVEFQSLALEYPKSARAGESWFKIGLCYQKLEQPAEAAKAFETLKTLYPSNPLVPEALYNAGQNYSDAADFSKAISVYAAILERYAESKFYFEAMLQLSLLWYKQGNTEQAYHYLNKITETGNEASHLAQAYFILGQIEHNNGNTTLAEKAFSTVLTKYKTTQFYHQASLNMGQIYLLKGNYKKAQSYLSALKKEQLPPEMVKTYQQALGDSYYFNKNFVRAEKLYKSSVQDTQNVFSALKYGLVLFKQGKKSAAINHLQNLNVKPDSPYASAFFNILIDWVLESGDNAKAAALLLERIKNEPDIQTRFNLVYRLAHIYTKNGQWQEIIREVAPYINSPVTSNYKDDLIFLLAEAYNNTKDFDKSVALYTQYLQQFSAGKDYNKAQENRAYLLEYSIVDLNNAVKSQLPILALPNTKEASNLKDLMIGKIYYTHYKDYTQARFHFEKAIAIDSMNKGDAHLYLGNTLLKLAHSSGVQQGERILLIEKANKQFMNAVENKATCSSADEASWKMVLSKLNVDSIGIDKQKQYIQSLIKAYPNSPFMEQWLFTLASDNNFSAKYNKEAIAYFERLIKEFSNSENSSTFIFQYAKLIKGENPQKALELLKELALEKAQSPEAIYALMEIQADFYEKKAYKEAAMLNKRLIDLYYYTEQATAAKNEMAQLYLKAAQYTEAMAQFTELTAHPFINDIVLLKEYLPAHFIANIAWLGSAQKKNGANDAAQKNLQKYLTLKPDGPLVSQVSYELAEIFLNKGRKDIALEYFSKIDAADSTYYNQALYYRAEILYENEAYAAAGKVYSQLDKLYTGKKEHKDIKGRFILTMIKNGQIKNAENEIKRYKKAFPNAEEYFASFILELGEKQRKAKNFDRALRYFKQIEKSYDETAYVDDAAYAKALTFIAVNRIEDAFEILTEYNKEYPNSDKLSDVFNTLGTLYFRVEKYDNAIASFKNALNLSKESRIKQQIMGNLIKTYALTGFHDAAQRLARQYVESFPHATDAIDKKMTIAQSFIHLNQFQNAVEYLKRMKLEADSEKEPEIQFYIGEALLKAGQYEEAIAEFVKIPLLSKKTKLQWEASALYYSGQAYEKLGRIPDAIRMYEEIVNRAGIDLVLKRDAAKRIKQIQG